MQSTENNRPFKIQDTEILVTDTPQQYRLKLARITLDSMAERFGLNPKLAKVPAFILRFQVLGH